VRGYELSERADEDLLGIFSYTIETWGEEQVPVYLNLITTALERIAADPFTMGSKPRNDLTPGCRTFRAGKHFIVYRVGAERVGVARILHDSMDFSHHVSEETFP
jgi:toxin ParE1/3/4